MHTLRIHLKTTSADKSQLSKRFRVINRIHNILVKRGVMLLYKLDGNHEYQELRKEYVSIKDSPDKDLQERKKLLSSEMSGIRKKIGLTKAAFEEYVKAAQKRYSAHITSHQAQAEAARVWAGIEAVLFGNGKKLHFRKISDMKTIGGKSMNGVRWYDPLHTGYLKKKAGPAAGWECQIEWNGLQIRADADLNDPYVYESLQGDIKYCEIERLPFRNGDRWYVILYIDSPAPKTIVPGDSTIGIDPGISAFNGASDTRCFLRELAPKASDYKKEIAACQRSIDRSKRITNPGNYNPDGTIKRGKHKWVLSGNCRKKLQYMRSLNRKCTAYTRQSHSELCNEVLRDSVNAVVEPIDYSALVRKPKKSKGSKNGPGGSDKTPAVKKKGGDHAKGRRARKRKRFGRSVTLRSPSTFLSILKRKVLQYGGTWNEVDRYTFRASQYRHDLDTYEKPILSQRWKDVGGNHVQRDLYSAFLIKNASPGLDRPDREACISQFDRFLELQAEAVLDTQLLGMSMPACFGF